MRIAAAIPVVLAALWLYAQQPEQLPAPREAAIVLDGWYAVEGSDADGSPYSGVCVIRRHGENYRCSWLLNSGITCIGVGVLEGDWFHVAATSGGVCVFRFKVDAVNGKPALSGYYATGEVRGKETLTLLRRPSL